MWPVVFYVSHVTMRILWFVSLCAPPPILRYGNSRMKAVVEKLGAHTVSILSSSLLTKQLLAMPTGPACLKHIAAVPEQRDNCDQWNVSEVQGPSQKMKQKDGRVDGAEESSGRDGTAALLTWSSCGCLHKIKTVTAQRGRGLQGTTHPYLRHCWQLMTVWGREGQFSSGLWPLVNCPLSRGCPHTYIHMGSTNETQWVRKKDI